jgi:hypothetical protein
MYITNRPDIAQIAERNGVDWVFVDLEIYGKQERQGHLDTVISHHSMCDVRKVKQVLRSSELLVRVNPMHSGSRKEINYVIEYGADIVMLPYFKTRDEVQEFVDCVDQRAKSCLLLETPEAVEALDSILSVTGIDFVHIGLNDLHLGYGLKFMFEPLADGTVERLCTRLKERQIRFGFGGIARLGEGLLPAERVICEHYRLGSSMAILSRSFCDLRRIKDVQEIEESFRVGIADIRDYEKKLSQFSMDDFESNRRAVVRLVAEIVERLNSTKTP